MVRAVDIEALFQKFLDEDNLEKCDALYLLFELRAERAAKTLRIRYGRAGAISSVLEDLKGIGVQELQWYEKTEDTQETVEQVVKECFKTICGERLVEAAIERAKSLSPLARELLYVVSVMNYEDLKYLKPEELRKFYNLLFSRNLTHSEFYRILDELVKCYIIDFYGDYFYFSPHLEKLVDALREFMPEVEVKVSWKETNRF